MLYDATKARAKESGTIPVSSGAEADGGQISNSVSGPASAQDQPGSEGSSNQAEDSEAKIGVKKGPEVWSVQFDFSHHSYYPVLRLKHASAPKK